jgi:hypothetical protein
MTTEKETVKVCQKCGEPKPVSEFYRESRGAHSRSSFRSVCKDCWDGKEPPTTDDERKEFVKRFILDYIAKNGETADLFLEHWISHKYPEITKEAVQRVIVRMPLRVTRRESTGDFNPVRFLALV